LLLVLVAFGVFVGAAMLGAGALLRLWTLRRKAPARAGDAIEGNFRAVAKPALPAR
jgi:acyl dehydratase